MASLSDASSPGQGRPDAGAPRDGASDGAAPGTDASPWYDAGAPGQRAIPPDVLSRQAIGYSGYRDGQSPDTQTYPTEAQVKEDLQILIRGGWTFLRLFDCSPFAASVLKVIRDNGFDVKVMSGIWIAGDKANHDAENQAQIDQCTALYATYGDIVVAVSVGNETLDSWSSVLVKPAELAGYIQEVRGRVTQPVTTDDSYLPFTLGQDGATSYANVVLVAKVVDFLSLHVYAFVDAAYDSWDWQQLSVPAGHARAVAMMGAALDYTKASLDQVRAAMTMHGLSLPIVIGEAGWKTSATDLTDDATEVYRAHPVNQKLFYDAFADWVYGASKDASSPIAAFTFEAFDEPWKTTDDGWGLFDVNRQARYVMWSTFPDLKPAGAPAYSDNDAVYYVAGDAGAP
ncbi:MAG TPA: glycosyl hydrolase family 17 protein [Polyangiaceae bacterium]|jgi:exo-beta-1,3-glucanase (GH17 family)